MSNSFFLEIPPEKITPFKKFWNGAENQYIKMKFPENCNEKEKNRIARLIDRAKKTFPESVIYFKVTKPKNKAVIQFYIQKKV